MVLFYLMQQYLIENVQMCCVVQNMNVFELLNDRG